MGSPFKHISQIKTLVDFTKLTKQVLDKVGEDPVKVQYFAKFKFDKKEAPLLLVGDIPTPVLMEVKKTGGTPMIGQCSVNLANQLVFEGAVTAGMARKVLTSLGIQRVVAGGADDEKEGGETQSETKETPPKDVKKTPPQAPPKVTTPTQKLPVVEEKTGTKPPTPPKAPMAKQPPIPPKKPEKPRIPKPGVTKEMLLAKDKFSSRLKTLYPLYQKALDTVGAPEADLAKLFKVAGDAAVATKYKEADLALDDLEKLVNTVLESKGSSSGEAEEKETDSESKDVGTGDFAKCRAAWQKAMQEASKSINALQTAVLKTKDPRAPGLASGFKRILTKLPNPEAALAAAADAAAKKDEEAGGKHKTEALRLAKLCSAYLGSDKMVQLALSNPFVTLKFNQHFKTALQTLEEELK